MTVTDDVQVSDLSERLWDAITNVRDAYPRRCDDAGTDELVDAIMPIIEDALEVAWDQGHSAGAHDYCNLAVFGNKFPPTPNPYPRGDQ